MTGDSIGYCFQKSRWKTVPIRVKPIKAHGLLVRGSLPLDALTFEKVVTSHEYVLVKFDTAYPFGDLHDEWKDIAKFSARNTELIAAEININQARLPKKFSYLDSYLWIGPSVGQLGDGTKSASGYSAS